MTTPEPTQAEVREGDVLAGKYRIERVLGAGGMGVVVAAHHLQLDEKVAIKFLLQPALGNPEAVARFAREARAAVKIKSEHVVRVTDVGTLDNGAPYMVMEYLEGMDLGGWIRRHGALPVELAVELVLQACEAVAHAHSLGIVHRDLKPANLFCIRRPDGRLSIKVLDFGISKVTGAAASGPDLGLTSTHGVLGSPYYASPEQLASSREVDARTDIWGLGAVLYELLTARVPFEGACLNEVCLKISTESPIPIRQSRPEVPPGIEAVILKCLAKCRDDRYPNVAELAVGLAPFGPKRAQMSVEQISRILGVADSADEFAMPPSSETQAFGAATQSAWGKTKSRGTSQRWVAAVGLVALSVLGAIGWIGWRRLGNAEPVTAADAAAPDASRSPSSETHVAAIPTPSGQPSSAPAFALDAGRAVIPTNSIRRPPASRRPPAASAIPPPPAVDPFAQPH